MQRLFLPHADDEIIIAGHAGIAHIGGAAGQHLMIGGRDMGVGADHEAGAAVAEEAHALLFAGRLAVEIDHDGVCRLAQRTGLELAPAATKGSLEGSMNTRPMALMTSARLPFLVSTSAAPRPGASAENSWADQAGARSMKTSASF